MKVFQINTVYNSGSTGRIAADIKRALEAQGDECFVAFGRGKSDEANTECISNKLDLYHHALMTRLTDKTGFYSKKATKRLIQKIGEFNPDIIHLHNIHGYYVNIEMLFKYLKKIGKPVVWTLHDCWTFTGHCSHFEYVKCEQWKTECRKCKCTEQYPSAWKDASKWNYNRKKNLFTGVDNMILVTPSQWLANLLGDSFLKKYPVQVINNGIETNVFKPTYGDIRDKYGLGTKKIVLGVANVWNQRKGLEDFLELSKKLDDNTIIVLVGVSEKQKSNLPEKVIGIERTESKEELAELYSAADVFFNPTYEDNYPTVNMEALSCGTPVVTYNTGGAGEMVEDKACVIEKGDYIKIVGMLENCENMKEKMKNISLSGFDKKNMIGNYISAYESLVK